MTNVEVKEISGDIVEWYYGTAEAIENRERFKNKVLNIHFLMAASLQLVATLIKDNVISVLLLSLSLLWITLYFANKHAFGKITKERKKEYELLLEYKRKYTFCAVSQIFINSWICEKYPEAIITLKFQDKENKVNYIDVKVRRKRNKHIKVPTLCVCDMTLYLTKDMEKELLIENRFCIKKI